MSETISQLPAGTASTMSDIVPLTQGSSGPGSGTTRKLTVAKILSASEVYYAADPAYGGGVIANGSADDTAAWTAVLNAASSTSGIVVAPVGVSVVSAITVPSNVMIVGYNTEPYGAAALGEQTYSAGTGSTSLGSVIQASSGSTTIVTMSAYSQLRDIQVVGTGGQTCINATAGRAEIINCDISSGATGVSCGNSAAGSVIRNCRIHHISGSGIDNPNGCAIGDNQFNSCGRAVSLTAGSNNNLITSNRSRFSSGAAFSVNSSSSGAYFNTFTGNFADRSGGNAFLLTYAFNTVVSGNGCFRSGRGSSGSPGNSADAHFALTNCTGVSVNGNTTSVWGDDSPLAIGYNSPYWAVYDGGGNTNCSIAANILVYHANSSVSAGTPINVTTTFNLASSLNVSYWSAGRLV